MYIDTFAYLYCAIVNYIDQTINNIYAGNTILFRLYCLFQSHLCTNQITIPHKTHNNVGG